MRNNKQLQAEY